MNKIVDNIEPLIKLIDERHSELDGMTKSALLKTVASYYENLMAAEAGTVMLKAAFDKLL